MLNQPFKLHFESKVKCNNSQKHITDRKEKQLVIFIKYTKCKYNVFRRHASLLVAIYQYMLISIIKRNAFQRMLVLINIFPIPLASI
jgi:hypothetical protein